jgi:hypothetical protein
MFQPWLSVSEILGQLDTMVGSFAEEAHIVYLIF